MNSLLSNAFNSDKIMERDGLFKNHLRHGIVSLNETVYHLFIYHLFSSGSIQEGRKSSQHD